MTARTLEIAGLAAALALAAGVARAAQPGGPDPAPPHLLEAPRLAGDPGGVRSRLERLGVGLRLFYNQTLAWKPRGGAEPKVRSGHSGSYDLLATANLEELAGWRGAGALVHAKGQYDRSINAEVGALSNPVDDADFDEGIYLDQLWLEQSLFSDRVRLRAGFFEQQTIFDRNAYANSEDRQFLATFLDNSGVVPLPDALAAALIVTPLPWLELAVGVADADNLPRSDGFDTAFDGLDSLNVYAEAAARVELPGPGGERLSGTWRAGVFRDGRRKRIFGRSDPATGAPRTRRGHLGAYLSLDQLVLRAAGGGPELGVFARLGFADEDTNRSAWFWSAGLQVTGLVPARDADALGIAAYQAIASDRFRRRVDGDAGDETGVELYYRIAVLPWLALTPDLQVIVDPGGSRPARDAVIAALRVRVTF